MATITALQATDYGDTAMSTINTNFTNVNSDLSTLDSGKEATITTLTHEKWGLEADVSAYTWLVAISWWSTSEVDSKAELEAQIADVSDFAMADWDIYTWSHDFGGADDFEIPNWAAPVVDTNWQIAIDTTVADFSHGIMKIYWGEEQGVVSMPISQFTTPTNWSVPTYNATNDKFELKAPLRAYKTADESTTSDTTLSDDADLTLTTEADGIYAFDAAIYVTVWSATPDLKDAWKWTSSTTWAIYSSLTTGATPYTDIDDAPTSQSYALTWTHVIIYRWVVDVWATGGSFTYQWSQNTSDGAATTIKKWSWIKLTKLN